MEARTAQPSLICHSPSMLHAVDTHRHAHQVKVVLKNMRHGVACSYRFSSSHGSALMLMPCRLISNIVDGTENPCAGSS